CGEGGGLYDSTMQITQVFAPTEGIFSGKVAEFADGLTGNTDPKKYSVTIDWGDGGTSSGNVTYNLSTGLFEVQGDHAYNQQAGTDVTVNVTVSLGGDVASGGTNVTLEDAPLFASPTNPVTNVSTNYPGILAQLDDKGNTSSSTDSYTASITWDNGPASNDVILQATGNGTFDIRSPKTFSKPGLHTYHIVINDSGGASTTVDGNLKVRLV